MGEWTVDTQTRKGVLWFVLSGSFTVTEMEAFVKAHNRAVLAYGLQPYRVFGDLRQIHPLSQECTELFAQAKELSSKRANFQGSAVVVSNKFAGMQNLRTSVSSGVAGSELNTEDEAAAWKFLETVQRNAARP